ncbi:MAG TPA: response regulator receiver protein [Candidatus Olsenella stercoravium]|uniref:Response regulator receiver protein n=1 Tax=Candidatus Olsenella stercoravium TaxID=2838713 RepID=A0A9D2IPL4_9ACTN|nr:response regulator receiver protein [Candidatus Olsenella stercoravium]
MAHDSRREDYLRMSLRFALSLDGGDPARAAREFATFGRRLARERDSLPQSDADRAFHLVSLATELVDYRLPFAGDALAETLVSRGRALLDEALSLDAGCHDAARMRFSLDTPSAEERHRFLSERADEVRAACEAERERLCDTLDEARRPLGASVAMRPWWRWLADMAECALICGRNRAAIDACERLLASDPRDLSDARFTLAYALAKLEDQPGLERLAARYPALAAPRAADDAWIRLAQIALAHKSYRLAEARRLTERLLDAYPGCAPTLIRQMEIPDGRFARIRVPAYGEDELIVAVSEGVVLLQEGMERTGKGVLGAWLARAAAELSGEKYDEGVVGP